MTFSYFLFQAAGYRRQATEKLKRMPCLLTVSCGL